MPMRAMGHGDLPHICVGSQVPSWCVRCCRRKDGTLNSEAVAYLPEEQRLAAAVERWLRDDRPADEAIADFERDVERVLRGADARVARRSTAISR